MRADTIELRGLRVLGICGALPEERNRVQPLQVDIDLVGDLSAACVSDDLDDTIDYAAVVSQVERLITSEKFTLLERLAERVASELLADKRVESVTVCVRKLRPAVPQQLETSGVRITRDR